MNDPFGVMQRSLKMYIYDEIVIFVKNIYKIVKYVTILLIQKYIR